MLRHRRRATPITERNLRERGETLIELMVTVVLMGTAVIGLISALFTVVASSEQFENASKANLASQDYAEQLRHAAYIPCAGVNSYTAYSPKSDGTGLPVGYTAVVTQVRYANYVAADQTAYPTQPWRWGIRESSGAIAWSNSCPSPAPYTMPSGGSADFGMQEITIRVNSPAGNHYPASESVVYVKRDTRCLVVYNPPDPTRPC